LKRLEGTELQLMTMMRSDYNNEAKQSTNQDSQIQNDHDHAHGLASGLTDDALLAALVEAKVALAEKEFEAMELVGKLRSKESYIEALSTRLAAVNGEVAARQTPAGRGRSIKQGTAKATSTASSLFSSASAGGRDARRTAATPDSHALCKSGSSSRASSALTPNKSISRDGPVVHHVYAHC